MNDDVLDQNGELEEKVIDQITGLNRSQSSVSPLAPKNSFANGRRAVLRTLDVMMGRRTNVQKLAKAIQERMDIDPIGFLKEIVIPLTPKNVIEETGDTGGGTKSVLILPANGREAPTQP